MLIPLLRLRKVGPSRGRNLPLRLRQTTGLSPWRWGRRPVAVPRPPARGKLAAGALVLALTRPGMPSRGPHQFVRGLEPWRGVARGLPVEVPAGGLFSLWGKIFGFTILFFPCICVLSRNGLSYARSSLLRLKRTLEQAQPSMAKRLKAGAASKDSG